MPIYEYECLKCNDVLTGKPYRFEMPRPIDRRDDPINCDICRGTARKVVSLGHWYMGWDFLKGKSEHSSAAPTGSGYYPEWDQAYGP